jgi:hypothetical protein
MTDASKLDKLRAGECFAALDGNRDGSVDADEWDQRYQYLQSLFARYEKEAPEIFARYVLFCFLLFFFVFFFIVRLLLFFYFKLLHVVCLLFANIDE